LRDERNDAKAKDVWIVLYLSAPDTGSLTVTDDGLGFGRKIQDMASAAEVRSMGVVIIKQRTEALGGNLIAEGEPGLGTKIAVPLLRERG